MATTHLPERICRTLVLASGSTVIGEALTTSSLGIRDAVDALALARRPLGSRDAGIAHTDGAEVSITQAIGANLSGQVVSTRCRIAPTELGVAFARNIAPNASPASSAVARGVTQVGVVARAMTSTDVTGDGGAVQLAVRSGIGIVAATSNYFRVEAVSDQTAATAANSRADLPTGYLRGAGVFACGTHKVVEAHTLSDFILGLFPLDAQPVVITCVLPGGGVSVTRTLEARRTKPEGFRAVVGWVSSRELAFVGQRVACELAVFACVAADLFSVQRVNPDAEAASRHAGPTPRADHPGCRVHGTLLCAVVAVVVGQLAHAAVRASPEPCLSVVGARTGRHVPKLVEAA